jgi:hypothetical protein
MRGQGQSMPNSLFIFIQFSKKQLHQIVLQIRPPAANVNVSADRGTNWSVVEQHDILTRFPPALTKGNRVEYSLEFGSSHFGFQQ